MKAVEPDSIAARAGLILGDAILGDERGPIADLDLFVASLARAASLDVVRGGRSVRIALPRATPGEDSRAA